MNWVLSFCLAVLAFYLFFSLKKSQRGILKEREVSTRHIYELAILKELGDRAGYSLDINEILTIITSSLRQLIDYSAVAFIVIGPQKLKLNIHIEKSLDQSFVKEMKERMIASLSALAEKEYHEGDMEEVVSGLVSIDSSPQKIGSFFNIPIVISGKLSGVLTIAHTKPGLYKEADMSILYKITGQASAAVTRLQKVVEEEQEKINKVREEYTSMIVHELRSPLDGIRKIIELIISGSLKRDSAEFGEYLNMVHQSSSSMLELVNDILDLSKLQAGKFEIYKEKADIKHVIEDRIAFYKISADVKKISISASMDASVSDFYQFDVQAIKQVLNNLISNALKFTSEGGSLMIKALLYGPGEKLPENLNIGSIPVSSKSVCVLVSDTGLGIPENEISMLFQTYKQAKVSPTAGEKGTGLGLAIAKGIMEAHGGTIGVVSKVGVGSTFYFTIPI